MRRSLIFYRNEIQKMTGKVLSQQGQRRQSLSQAQTIPISRAANPFPFQ
ncbi:hypothetical protein Q9233_000431 [Columba guinea]|nr:hypothetical protein Q9233_000431 [Columba guinea]